jgi:hypothetical protein
MRTAGGGRMTAKPRATRQQQPKANTRQRGAGGVMPNTDLASLNRTRIGCASLRKSIDLKGTQIIRENCAGFRKKDRILEVR